MRRNFIVVLLLTLATSGSPVHAQSNDMGVPDIMKPEPWTAPKYKSPRGTVQQPARPRVAPTDEPPRIVAPAIPPTLYVPQTGRTLPNMPTVSPSGRGGRETYQDRAVRCAHQAGAYGALAGDRNSYIGTCINQ